MTITKGQMAIMNGGDTHMKKRTLFTERASDFLESVFSSSDVSILSSEVCILSDVYIEMMRTSCCENIDLL